MAFCQNCGQPVPENANHCPACGAAVAPQPQAPRQPSYQQPGYQPQTPPQAPQQPDFRQNNGFQQPVAPVGDPDVIANKGIAWLSYLGVLLLIPLFSRKTSEYCRHHVKQGVILCLVELAYAMVSSMIEGIVWLIAPPVYTSWYGMRNSIAYTVVYWIFFVGSLFLLAVAIIGIVAAASGKKDKLFVFGKIPFIEKLVDPVIDMTYEVLNKQK